MQNQETELEVELQTQPIQSPIQENNQQDIMKWVQAFQDCV